MNYEELSDFEINKRVAKSKKLKGTHQQNGVAVSCYHGYFDPCNNPADAWPIIEEIWSTLMQVCLYDFNVGLGASECSRWEGLTHIHGGNKFRAAMICYLMMREAK